MGMSASQARYIQLTARMSDLELEGQQINQQRLNLANQSSAIQEEALKMPVPTAPSTYDYMRDVYKGKDGNGQDLKAGTPDKDGNIPISTFSAKGVETLKTQGDASNPGVKIDEKQPPAANNKNMKAKYRAEVPVDCYKGGTENKQIEKSEYDKKKQDVASKETDLKGKNHNSTEQPVQSSFKKLNTEAYNTACGNWKNSEPTKPGSNATDEEKAAYNTAHENWEDSEPKESDYQMDDVDAYNAASEAYTAYTTAKADFESYKPDKYYVKSNTADADATASNAKQNYEHAHGINATGQAEEIEYTYQDPKNDGTKSSKLNGFKAAADGYSRDQIKELLDAKPSYYVDENGKTALSINDFDEFGKLNEGVKLYQMDQTHEVLGGSTAYDLEEINGSDTPWAKNAAQKDLVDQLVQRIKNYEANNNEKSDGMVDGAELSKWRITQDSEGGLHAFKIDAGKAQEYTPDTVDKGWKTQNGKANNFNTNGVSNVTLEDGSQAYLTKSQELDTDAYKAAEAEYTNKKAQYDHAQEEANTKVKKLQTIDKQLELKLKRLDTERNALNTEIDAVKKVIQDNTDKSFKTFSG